MPKHPFDYHRPSENQVSLIADVRARCYEMHELFTTLRNQGLIDPRCAALAITKLEELSMWANKGIVLVEEGPVEHPAAGTRGASGTQFEGRIADGHGGWVHPDMVLTDQVKTGDKL